MSQFFQDAKSALTSGNTEKINSLIEKLTDKGAVNEKDTRSVTRGT